MRGGNAQDRRRARRSAERRVEKGVRNAAAATVEELTDEDRDLIGELVAAAQTVETVEPTLSALERFDIAFPDALRAAAGDLLWGPEEGFVDLLCDVNEVLGATSGGSGDDDMVPRAGPRAVDASVKLDKVLVCDYGDDGSYWIAPISIDENGEPVVSARSEWSPVEQGWVEAVPDPDEADPSATAAAGIFRFQLRNLIVGELAAPATMPEVEMPDAHKPGSRIPKRNRTPDTPTPPAGAQAGSTSWTALFLPEAKLTDDGRAFAPDSVTWRDLPLSLMAMTETSAQGGHDGAQIAGRIDRIWRDGNEIKASGVFDDGEYGSDIARMVADGTLRGLSVDTAIHEYEVGPRSDYFTDDGEWRTEQPVAAADTEEPSLLDLLFGDEDADRIFVVTKAVIGMATVCPFPAFAEANISLAASGAIWRHTHQGGFIVVQEQAGEALVAGAAVEVPLGETATVEGDGTGVALDPVYDESLTAAGAGLAPLEPPAEWFANPGLDELTPLTVDDQGRIYGHAWSWDTCHLSFPDSCVLAPRSRSENSYFHLGEVECEGGERVAVGRVTLDTGHAGPRASRLEAVSHYDDTGTVAAHVRCGEDEFGGWFSGAINPELSAEKLRILRGAALSGDWRAVRFADGASNLELVALLAVNVPGFPVPRQPRALVASGGGDCGCEDEVLALTAAGIVVARTDEQEFAEIAALAADARADAA